MSILNPSFSVFSLSDFKHWWRTMEVNGFLSKNSPSLSRMQILIKKAFPYNSRKLLVGQLLMCSSWCDAKKCAQHQITSYVQLVELR